MPTLDPRTQTQAKAAFAQHVMREAPSRSFRFSKPGTSAYLFTLTWTPGMVAISGDVGEIQVVHYQALARFEDGMFWLQNCDPEYLFGKCPKFERQYDKDETVKGLREALNEEPRRYLNGYKPSWHGGRREKGYRHELHRWRRERFLAVTGEADGGEFWLEDDGRVERPEGDPRAFVQRPPRGPGRDPMRFSEEAKIADYWDIPDCWDRWIAAWRFTIGAGWYPECSYLDPRDVLKPEIRKEIMNELDGMMDTIHDAADVFYKLGWDDPSISMSYPGYAAYYYEALMFGARQITASLTLAWGDPVC